MTADVRVTDRIFGQTVLDKYNLKCWWEEALDFIVKLNIIILFLSGLSFNDGRAICIHSFNDSLTFTSDKLADFVSAKCSNDRYKFNLFFGDPNYFQFLVVFLTLTPLANSRFWFNCQSFRNTTYVYAEAEKRFKALNTSKSWDVIKQAVFQFSCTKNQIVEETHSIVKLLWQCKPHRLLKNILREIVITWFVLCSMGYWLFCFGGAVRTLWKPCELTEFEDSFACIIPQSKNNWLIFSVYGILTTLHLVIRTFGLIKIILICWKSWYGSKTKNMCTLSFSDLQEGQPEFRILNRAKSSRNSILYLNWLAKECRVSDSDNFIEFVDFVFSKDFVHFIYRLRKEKKDEGQLTEIVESILGERYDFTDEKLKKLIEEKKWRTIVGLLKIRNRSERGICLKQACNGPEHIFTEADCQRLDKNGRSLLYYALHREKGQLHFNARAAEIILEVTKARNVYFREGTHDKAMDAKEFVLNEYKNDVSYPTVLTEKLLQFIEKVQPTSSTEVRTSIASCGSTFLGVTRTIQADSADASSPLLGTSAANHIRRKFSRSKGAKLLVEEKGNYGSFEETKSDHDRSSV